MVNKKINTNAERLHEHVPPDWYFQSIVKDPFQRIWHKSRFRQVENIIEPTGGRILDVGCADGVFSKVIFDKSKPREMIGIDILANSVKWAKGHWKNNKIRFLVGDADKLDFRSSYFDAVFCMEVLEHVFKPRKVMAEFYRVMKKGGYGIFLVPSDSVLFRLIWFIWLKFYPRGWVWRDTHIQTYRNSFLPKLCKNAGFKVEVDKKFNLGMLHLVKVRKI